MSFQFDVNKYPLLHWGEILWSTETKLAGLVEKNNGRALLSASPHVELSYMKLFNVDWISFWAAWCAKIVTHWTKRRRRRVLRKMIWWYRNGPPIFHTHHSPQTQVLSALSPSAVSQPPRARASTPPPLEKFNRRTTSSGKFITTSYLTHLR